MGTEETKRQTHKLIYFKGTIRYRNIKQMENKKQKVKDTQIDTSYRKQKRQKGKQKKTEQKTQIDTFYRKHKIQKGRTEETETETQRRKLMTNKRRS